MISLLNLQSGTYTYTHSAYRLAVLVMASRLAFGNIQWSAGLAAERRWVRARTSPGGAVSLHQIG